MMFAFVFSFCCLFGGLIGAPVDRQSKDVILVPTRLMYPSPYGMNQVRGPFDFIGNWIQSSEWFPIEINVPDTAATVGNGVGQLASNVGQFATSLGTNFNTFAQGVGTNVQGIVQDLTNRFPLMGNVIRPTTGVTGTPQTQRFVLLVPVQNMRMGQGPLVNDRIGPLRNMMSMQNSMPIPIQNNMPIPIQNGMPMIQIQNGMPIPIQNGMQFPIQNGMPFQIPNGMPMPMPIPLPMPTPMRSVSIKPNEQPMRPNVPVQRAPAQTVASTAKIAPSAASKPVSKVKHTDNNRVNIGHMLEDFP